MCSGKGKRTMKNCPSDRYQQVIPKICNSATDKNMAGVKEIDQAGKHIAHHLTAGADNIERSLITFTASRVDVFGANYSAIGLAHLTQGGADSLLNRLHRLGRDRWSRGHCLQASLVATRAQRSIFIHADVTD